MMKSSPSRTALAMSLMRALHSRFNSSPLFEDPWAIDSFPKLNAKG